MRWFAPVAFALVAAGVAWVQATSPDTRIVFPFLEMVVGHDPDALSQATIGLLLLLSAGTGLGALRGARADEDPGGD